MRCRFKDVVGELTSLPGCSQVVVSHAVYAIKPGTGTEANKLRTEHMKELGYDYAICTVESTNAKQLHILEKNGWNQLDSFTSSKTNHTIIIYGKDL